MQNFLTLTSKRGKFQSLRGKTIDISSEALKALKNALKRQIRNFAIFRIFALMIFFANSASAYTWQQAVYHYAKLYKLNPCVVFAIIDTESSGNPNTVTVNRKNRYWTYRKRQNSLKAVSYRYENMDIGLMQINYYWISKKLRIKKRRLLDPLYNIDIGEWLLRQLLNKYGDYTKAVMHYQMLPQDLFLQGEDVEGIFWFSMYFLIVSSEAPPHDPAK